MSFPEFLPIFYVSVADLWTKVLHFFRSDNEQLLEEPVDYVLEDGMHFEEFEMSEDVAELEVLEFPEKMVELEVGGMPEQDMPMANAQGGAQNVACPLIKSMQGINIL